MKKVTSDVPLPKRLKAADLEVETALPATLKVKFIENSK